MTKCMIIELKTTPLQNQWQPCHPHRIPDRLMYQTGAEMGEKTSIGQQVTASLQTQELTMSSKNRFSTRVAGSTQHQSYCRHRHQMTHRLMYDTGETMG
jgi:hypothetical protein